jgi:ketol-acid reductoisomerase
MNVVISDTAEYGCYLFSQTCVPLLADFMRRQKADVIGKGLKPMDRSGDNHVDNMELVKVNAAIRNHPVEVVGRKLRGYMTAMKPIV